MRLPILVWIEYIINMKAVRLILILIMFGTGTGLAQTVKPDSLTSRLLAIRVNPEPGSTLTRSAAMDRAAECQARYMLRTKTATHSQPAGSGLEQPKNRVMKQGISPKATVEVAWFSTAGYYSPGVNPAVDAFKRSELHWKIMTGWPTFHNWLYGYARISDGVNEVCVIVYAQPE